MDQGSRSRKKMNQENAISQEEHQVCQVAATRIFKNGKGQMKS